MNRATLCVYPNQAKGNSKAGKIPMYLRVIFKRQKAEVWLSIEIDGQLMGKWNQTVGTITYVHNVHALGSISIYPNPAKERLTVSAGSRQTITRGSIVCPGCHLLICQRPVKVRFKFWDRNVNIFHQAVCIRN